MTWTDTHAERLGRPPLIRPEEWATISPIGMWAARDDWREAPVTHVFRGVTGGWLWFLSEADPDGRCFGYVHGFENELGYFDLEELATVVQPGSNHGAAEVVRVEGWEAMSIGEVIKEVGRAT